MAIKKNKLRKFTQKKQKLRREHNGGVSFLTENQLTKITADFDKGKPSIFGKMKIEVTKKFKTIIDKLSNLNTQQTSDLERELKNSKSQLDKIGTNKPTEEEMKQLNAVKYNLMDALNSAVKLKLDKEIIDHVNEIILEFTNYENQYIIGEQNKLASKTRAQQLSSKTEGLATTAAKFLKQSTLLNKAMGLKKTKRKMRIKRRPIKKTKGKKKSK